MSRDRHLLPSIPGARADLLRSLIGQRISVLTNYDWSGDASPGSDQIAFSAATGPLAIEFESGDLIAIAVSDSINSAIVFRDDEDPGPRLAEDPDLVPISAANDPRFATLVGRMVVGVSFLGTPPPSPMHEGLGNQTVVRLAFDEGPAMLAGLIFNSSDLAVVFEDACTAPSGNWTSVLP